MTSKPGFATPTKDPQAALLALNSYEARVAAAAFERIFPADATGPGATDLGVVTFLDRALMGAYSHLADTYRYGLAALDTCARTRHGRGFPACSAAEQDALLADMERGDLPGFVAPPPAAFFALLRAHCQEGLFADPAYGGNCDKAAWRWLGHPGIFFENSAEENLATAPATKGGRVQSLADVGFALDGGPREPQHIPGYDPQAGARPPAGPADVVLVGVGAANALAAKIFAQAGLRVVGLEAGPYRWFEEPSIPEDVPGHAMLARELTVPIAIGESLHSPFEYQRYVDERALHVLQIDPITNGGITVSLRALTMADAAGLRTSSHYTDELSAHLLCASRGAVYLEKHAFALDAYLREPQKVVDGHVRPTEVPGTGMRFAEAALAPYRAD